MSPIPTKLREQLSNDPYYKKCSRAGKDCLGRITWEHAWTYANKQIQERWAIIPLCVYHHLGLGLVKKANQLIALNRATPEDLKKYPNKDWSKERLRLNQGNK